MVFPQDPEWRREYQRHKGNDPAGHVRYRSWGTEELLVKCCMKYMPWVRRTYILLAQESQVQPWMRDLAAKPQGTLTEVRLVFHKDFMPEKYLPCFSSPCIEMFLHGIPGLSEQFIYANDDMFPLSPLAPTDFFRPAGPDGTLLPCLRFKEKEYPASPNVFQRKCMYQTNMVGRPFGIRYTTTWLKSGHSFAPILKSSCEEVWRRHGDEIAMHLSPLTRTGHSHNHYIYLLYQWFSGLAADHVPRQQYVGQGTPTSAVAGIIRDPEAGIVCLNDNENILDWERRARIVRAAIADNLGR